MKQKIGVGLIGVLIGVGQCQLLVWAVDTYGAERVLTVIDHLGTGMIAGMALVTVGAVALLPVVAFLARKR